MQSKQLIRIAMRLTEAIIEILKEEVVDNKKVKDNDARRKKTMVKKAINTAGKIALEILIVIIIKRIKGVRF